LDFDDFCANTLHSQQSKGCYGYNAKTVSKKTADLVKVRGGLSSTIAGFISMHELTELATRQLSDYKNNTPGTWFAEPVFNLNINLAYELQDTVTQLRLNEGNSIAGYKIGCIGKDVKEQFGMNGPIRGTLFSSEMFSNNAVLSASAFCNLAVEAEMAFVIDAYFQIKRVFPVIELHNFIFRAPQKNLPELIGNNGINCGVVVPGQEQHRSIEDLDQLVDLSLQINDSRYSTNQLWPIDSNPLGSLGWLQKNLSSYNKKLEAGQLILAGTTLGLYTVRAGDQINVDLNGETILSCLIQ
jgi:2-keto-4-pentenoate hydratase